MKAKPSGSSGRSGENLWRLVTEEAAWSRRDSMGSAIFDGKMWILGGYTPERVNDVWYSSDGVEWRRVIDEAPWIGRNLPCTVVYDGKIWMMGGGTRLKPGVHVSCRDVWYSSDGRIWRLATDDPPWGPRGAATALVYEGRIWMMGGFNAADYTHNCEVWTSRDGRSWELVTDKAEWGARAMHTSVVFDDKMWVIGGGVYNEAYPSNTVIDYNDVWCSSDGVEWCRVTESADWTARRFHCSVVYRDKIWVIAGYHYGNRNDVWCSSDGRIWHEVEGTRWPRRHAPVCLVYKDKLWLLGGFGDILYNDVWAYEEPRGR